ncbi:MAG: aldolase/citrate lyase family protein, partial [Longimicrobiales bacterium]
MEGLEGSGSGGAVGVGQAGRRGADVRSDCWVSVEPSGADGIRLALNSKVGSLVGTSIRESVEGTLMTLGAKGIRVVAEDQGALPWVLQARAEAAFRRYSPPADDLDARPPRTAPLPPGEGSPKDRLRRSRLYLPGNEPKFMVNAGLHRPDGVILDLEDSVHPAEKDAARLL